MSFSAGRTDLIIPAADISTIRAHVLGHVVVIDIKIVFHKCPFIITEYLERYFFRSKAQIGKIDVIVPSYPL